MDANRLALLNYLLNEPIGSYIIEKLDRRLFKIYYPGDFVEVLIARAAKLSGATPLARIRNYRWCVRIGNIRFKIERFLEHCVVHATLEQFCNIINVAIKEKRTFIQLPRPSILAAFGRIVDVGGTLYHSAEKQNQVSDRALMHLFHAYEALDKKEWSEKLGIPQPTGKSIKSLFLAGRRMKLSPRWPLPENTTLPVTRVEIPQLIPKTEISKHSLKPSLHIPSGRKGELFRTVARQQYDYLKGCLVPGEVECQINGRRLVGRVSAVDQAIYTPIWTMDHFFNCFAMLDFDLPLAKSMIFGG